MNQLVRCSFLLAVSFGMIWNPVKHLEEGGSEELESYDTAFDEVRLRFDEVDVSLMEGMALRGLNANRPPKLQFDLIPFCELMPLPQLKQFLRSLERISQNYANVDAKIIPAGQPFTEVTALEAREIVALGLMGMFPLDLLNLDPVRTVTRSYPMLKSLLNYLTSPLSDDYTITFKLASLPNESMHLGQAFPKWAISEGMIGDRKEEVSVIFTTSPHSFQTMLHHRHYHHRVMAAHPDLIVAAHLMRDGFSSNQGLYVSGHRAYSSPKGDALQDPTPLKAVFISAAGNYKSDPFQQYAQDEIVKELVKATAAFSAIPEGEIIATGKWGCGGFGGNPFLKLVIQMLAASITGHRLHLYLPNSNNKDGDGLSIEELHDFLQSFSQLQPNHVIKVLFEVCEFCRRKGSYLNGQMFKQAFGTFESTVHPSSSVASEPKARAKGLAAVWPVTKAYIESNSLLMEACKKAADSSKLISYDPTFAYYQLPADTVIQMMDSDTVSAAAVLAGEGRKVLIVNFANNYQCGGGYKRDANAQEEDIFRRTTAAFAISREYGLQQAEFYPIATGKEANAVITDHLRILRKSKSEGFTFVNEQEQYEFAMITVGAYDQRSKTEQAMFQADSNLLTKTGCRVMKKRIALIFQAASHLHCDTIIAGALGCGAFGNDPDQIAQLHQEVIQRYPGLVKELVFAIPRSSTRQTFNVNFDSFAMLFHQ